MRIQWKRLSGALVVLLIGLQTFAPAANGLTGASQPAASGRSPQSGAAASVSKQKGPDPQTAKIVAGEPVVPTLSPALSDLPLYQPEKGLDREINPRLSYNRPLDPNFDPPGGPDPLLAVQKAARPAAPNAFGTPILNFNGQGYTNVNPPDTVGDVGPNHYIQMINGSGGGILTVYNKTTGAVISGPTSLDSLGAGACASGLGDGIVLYDQAADRWLLGEFASSGNHLCVYVSQTASPTGAYYAYNFITPVFPDYPKFGVWPDAYYVTTNESSPTVYALDRAKMLAGLTATSQRATAPNLAGFGFQSLTPADLDGPAAPPASSPGLFMRHVDTEVHGVAGYPTQDILEVWRFQVDWTTPANSSFAKLPDILVSEFDSTLCGLSSFYCMAMPGVAQGSTSSLDPIREVIMNRLAYRNFGGHETLVGNFVTDVDGANQGGVRWFELRKSGAGAWSLYQEGTYSPTGDNRWMGAIAMDGAGNVALGYNVSSGTVSPSLRYTGRLASDTLGTMTQGDNVLVNGTATNGSNRYGDYAAMSVDPSDDCTFWFTGEWNGASTWSTRIGKFKFDQCGTPDFTISATPASQSVCQGSDATYNVDVWSISGFNGAVTLSASGNPGTAGFVPNSVTPPANGSVNSALTISAAGAGSYNFNVTGTSGATNHSTPLTLVVDAAPPGAPALTAPANNATNVPALPTFTWSAGAGASTYAIQVATDAGFTNIVASASGLTGLTWTSNVTLNTSTTYHWRVQSANACGNGAVAASEAFSPVFTFRTVAAPGDCGPGTTANTLYQYGFEAGAAGWTHSAAVGADSWAIVTTNPHSGTSHYRGLDPTTISDQRLVSPAVALPSGQNPVVLKFWHLPNLEPSGTTACFDGGILEVSTDAGVTWTQVPAANLLAGSYKGPVSASFSNPLATLPAWCGTTTYINTIADISAYAGQTAQFRMRLGSDSSDGNPGWDIDDVTVQSCSVPTAVTLRSISAGTAPAQAPGGPLGALPVAAGTALAAGFAVLAGTVGAVGLRRRR